MDQVTAKVLVDGVRDIAVASLNKTPMNPNDLGPFLRRISDSLVDCLKDADAVISTPTAPTAPAAQAEGQQQEPSRAEAVIADEVPAQAAEPQAKDTTVQAAAAPAQPATARAEAPKAPAAEEKPSPAPAAPAKSETAEAAPAPKKKRKAGYKFAHIPREPVVPKEQSVGEDFIVCLIDGEKRKMLHRHLKSKYQMSEDEYRKHFRLQPDYPMTAPGYSKEKRLVAIDQGLGKKEAQPASEAPEPAKVTKRQRSRPVPADA